MGVQWSKFLHMYIIVDTHVNEALTWNNLLKYAYCLAILRHCFSAGSENNYIWTATCDCDFKIHILNVKLYQSACTLTNTQNNILYQTNNPLWSPQKLVIFWSAQWLQASERLYTTWLVWYEGTLTVADTMLSCLTSHSPSEGDPFNSSSSSVLKYSTVVYSAGRTAI